MPMLDRRLFKAYKNFKHERFNKGNSKVWATQYQYQRSFMNCFPETVSKFGDMIHHYRDFFATDDKDQVMKDNYSANKDLVDDQLAQGLKTWDEGVYFDAGMFYGRAWYYLAYGQPI